MSYYPHLLHPPPTAPPCNEYPTSASVTAGERYASLPPLQPQRSPARACPSIPSHPFFGESTGPSDPFCFGRSTGICPSTARGRSGSTRSSRGGGRREEGGWRRPAPGPPPPPRARAWIGVGPGADCRSTLCRIAAGHTCMSAKSQHVVLVVTPLFHPRHL